MGRTKPREYDTPTIVRALEGIAAGRPALEMAREIGASDSTVRAWAERYGVPLERAHGRDEPPPIVAGDESDDDPPDPQLDEPLPEGTTSLEDARLLQREAWSISRAARKAGNLGAAQRAHRDAMAATAVIARLERWQGEAGDAIRTSRAEINRAMASLAAKARVMTQRPLLCAQCHRALMVAWGTPRPALDDPTTKAVASAPVVPAAGDSGGRSRRGG